MSKEIEQYAVINTDDNRMNNKRNTQDDIKTIMNKQYKSKKINNNQNILTSTYSKGSLECFGMNKPNIIIRNYYTIESQKQKEDDDIVIKNNNKKTIDQLNYSPNHITIFNEGQINKQSSVFTASSDKNKIKQIYHSSKTSTSSYKQNFNHNNNFNQINQDNSAIFIQNNNSNATPAQQSYQLKSQQQQQQNIQLQSQQSQPQQLQQQLNDNGILKRAKELPQLKMKLGNDSQINNNSNNTKRMMTTQSYSSSPSCSPQKRRIQQYQCYQNSQTLQNILMNSTQTQPTKEYNSNIHASTTKTTNTQEKPYFQTTSTNTFDNAVLSSNRKTYDFEKLNYDSIKQFQVKSDYIIPIKSTDSQRNIQLQSQQSYGNSNSKGILNQHSHTKRSFDPNKSSSISSMSSRIQNLQKNHKNHNTQQNLIHSTSINSNNYKSNVNVDNNTANTIYQNSSNTIYNESPKNTNQNNNNSSSRNNTNKRNNNSQSKTTFTTSKTCTTGTTINNDEKNQTLRFGRRELYLPIQTLRQMNTQKKYEESMNTFLECNTQQLSSKELQIRRNQFPFKATFDRYTNQYQLYDQNNNYNDYNNFMKTAATTMSSSSNKFTRLSQDYQNQKRNKNKNIFFQDYDENNNNNQNEYMKYKNDYLIENSKIQEEEQQQFNFQNDTIIRQRKGSQQDNNNNNYNNEDQLDEDDQSQLQMNNMLKNRQNIGNLIRLIEEFPFDCLNGQSQSIDQTNNNQSLSQSKYIQNDLKSQSKTKNDENDDQSPSNNNNNNSKIQIYGLNSKQQQQDKVSFLDISFTEQAKLVEKQTKQYILNQDKLYDFLPLRAQKERKNLDGRALRLNLIKVLNFLKTLNLKPKELLNNNVFSKKPFEKVNSYNLITAAKHNDILQCQDLLSKNKYLVYDFDFVYMTALHWSCKRGHAKLSQLLIDKGADVNALDILGKPPLYFAAQSGHLDVVRVLLFNKAYPWSTKYVNYEIFERQYPLVSSALLTARKISVLLKMTPHKYRNLLWQKEGIAFEQILN